MPAVPPSTHAVADFPGGDTFAYLSNAPDDFVPRNNGTADW